MGRVQSAASTNQPTSGGGVGESSTTTTSPVFVKARVSIGSGRAIGGDTGDGDALTHLHGSRIGGYMKRGELDFVDA